MADIGIGIPLIDPGLFTTVFSFLTWDMSFFRDWLNPFRYLLTAITFMFTLFALRDFTGPLMEIARFAGAALGGLIGGAGRAAAQILGR